VPGYRALAAHAGAIAALSVRFLGQKVHLMLGSNRNNLGRIG
jgi:hypothetical protein